MLSCRVDRLLVSLWIILLQLFTVKVIEVDIDDETICCIWVTVMYCDIQAVTTLANLAEAQMPTMKDTIDMA